MIKNVSILLLPLLAAGALAQDAEPEKEEVEVRRYTVEMMIFAYEQSLSGGSEIFMPDEPPPLEFGEDGDLINFILDDGMVPADAAKIDEPDAHQLQSESQDIDERYAFVMLPEEDFVLLDVVADLDELDAYIPLMHFGWTQPMIPDGDTEVRSLSSFATPPEGLEGDLSLYLSRYLHLAVNLQMDASTVGKMSAGEVPEEMSDRYNFSDGINEIGFDDMGDNGIVTYPVRYRIEEDRIVRNGELRYYDHPKFGVLAKITRVEKQEPDEFEDDLEGELLGYDGE